MEQAAPDREHFRDLQRKSAKARSVRKAEDYIKRLVDTAPPLTPEQRARLAVLLRPSALVNPGNSGGGARHRHRPTAGNSNTTATQVPSQNNASPSSVTLAEPSLFDAVISTHPDHGARISWTVATPEELRDQGLAKVERHASAWEREALDRVIATVAAEVRAHGGTLSANDVRGRLHEGVHRPLIGSRFRAAALRGELRHAGYVRSSDPRTHGALVAVWRPL